MDLRCKNGCASINHARYFEKHKKVKPHNSHTKTLNLCKKCVAHRYPRIDKAFTQVKKQREQKLYPRIWPLQKKSDTHGKHCWRIFEPMQNLRAKKLSQQKKKKKKKTSRRENAIHKIQPTATLIQLSAPQFVFPGS